MISGGGWGVTQRIYPPVFGQVPGTGPGHQYQGHANIQHLGNH